MPIQGADLGNQVGRLAIIIDDVIGSSQSSCPVYLCGHDFSYRLLRELASYHCAPDLGLLVTIDNQNAVRALTIVGGLNQQRYHQDTVRAWRGLSQAPLGNIPNQGMKYLFQVVPRYAILEYQCTHGRSVHAPFSSQSYRAKNSHNRGHRGALWLRELMRKNVRIHHNCPEVGKQFCDTAFAAADTAS